jgi:hypothetical protein
MLQGGATARPLRSQASARAGARSHAHAGEQSARAAGGARPGLPQARPGAPAIVPLFAASPGSAEAPPTSVESRAGIWQSPSRCRTRVCYAQETIGSSADVPIPCTPRTLVKIVCLAPNDTVAVLLTNEVQPCRGLHRGPSDRAGARAPPPLRVLHSRPERCSQGGLAWPNSAPRREVDDRAVHVVYGAAQLRLGAAERPASKPGARDPTHPPSARQTLADTPAFPRQPPTTASPCRPHPPRRTPTPPAAARPGHVTTLCTNSFIQQQATKIPLCASPSWAGGICRRACTQP